MMEAVSQWFRCCLSIKFFIHLVVSCGSWPTAISIARRSDDHARTRHQTPPLIKSHLSHTSEGPFTLGAPTTSWSEWPKICLAVVVALLYVENSMDQLFLIHKKESFGTVPTIHLWGQFPPKVSVCMSTCVMKFVELGNTHNQLFLLVFIHCVVELSRAVCFVSVGRATVRRSSQSLTKFNPVKRWPLHARVLLPAHLLFKTVIEWRKQ